MIFISLWIISGMITELILLSLVFRNGEQISLMELLESVAGAIVLGMVGLAIIVGMIGYSLFLENKKTNER